MISPGRRSGSSELVAVGSWMLISDSHCEYTLAVTKKQRREKQYQNRPDIIDQCGKADV